MAIDYPVKVKLDGSSRQTGPDDRMVPSAVLQKTRGDYPVGHDAS
jgi:hypothetical protein